jgi:hypothetical protein
MPGQLSAVRIAFVFLLCACNNRAHLLDSAALDNDVINLRPRSISSDASWLPRTSINQNALDRAAAKLLHPADGGARRLAAAADVADATTATVAPLPPNPTSTRRALIDAEPDATIVPQPQLYYDDKDGHRMLIWNPDDTLPRDVLAGRPEVWLYCLLAADYGGPSLLPHFLEHYSRLGIHKDRMLFIVNQNPASQGSNPRDLEDMRRLLDAFGADYRVWLGQYSADTHLKFKLQVGWRGVQFLLKWMASILPSILQSKIENETPLKTTT